MLLTQQLAKFLKTATKEELKDFQFKLNYPEYEHRPVSMKEFIENPTYTHPADAPRPNNKRLLIDFFDTYDTWDEFKFLGKYEEMLYIAGIGSGKTRSPETPVLMYDGTIKMFKDIKVGDVVMGDDSTKRIVQETHTVFDDAYKITTTNGEELIIKHDHILSFKNGNEDVRNKTIAEYKKTPKKQRDRLHFWRPPVYFPDRSIATDPSDIGRWLATNDCSGMSEATKGRLSSMSRHIPIEYKVNSRIKRLALVASFIDSFWNLSFTMDNRLLIECSHKTISSDLWYVFRSLGMAAYQRGNTLEVYGNLRDIPSKKIRFRMSKEKYWADFIEKIEPIGKTELVGFSVDGNHLFIDGTFTVDHNSYASSKCIQYVLHRLLCLKNPQQYFGPKPNGLAPGSKIAFINISKSFSQAKDVVFGEIKNRIDHSPWFQHFYPPDPRIKSILKFKKNIFVLPLASNEEAPLGYNIFGAVIDEASFHVSTKDKDYAEESYNQIKKRLRSRFLNFGKLFIITSPRYVNDFAENKMREDGNDKLFKRRVPLWEAMPPESFCGDKFDIGNYLSEYKGTMCPVEYENEFKQNPEKAMRDYGAQASLAIEAFFKDHKIIIANANASRKHPYDPVAKDFYPWFYNKVGSPTFDGRKYFIHCDLGLNKGGKGDFAGLGMVAFDGWQACSGPDGKVEKRPKLYIAYMERIEAGPKEEILFSTIRERIYRLREIGYNIAQVSYDGWSSIDSIQTLNSTGFKAVTFSVDRNPTSYYTLKSAILEGRIDYYYYKPLIEELQQLEEIKGNKIDHPRAGHKDVSDGVAGGVYFAAKGTPGVGILGVN